MRAGDVTAKPGPSSAPAGHALDWLVLLGVLAPVAGAVFLGPVFMPASGFVQSRAPLSAFEQGMAVLGAVGLVRWLLFGGRPLPAAILGVASVATALGLLALSTTTDLYSTRDAVFFLASIVLLTLSVAVAATDGVKTRTVLAALVLVGVCESITGLAQYAGGTTTPAYWLSHTFAGAIRTRIYGTLANPNVLATFLLVGIGAAMLTAVDLVGKARLVPILALWVQIAALALTYSRGGYAGLTALLLSAAALLAPVRRRAWPVLLSAAVLAGVAAVTLPSVGLRAGSFTLDEADTAQSRLFIWRTAIRMWEAHRVWGAGLGTFNAAYSAYRPPGVMTTYAALRIPGSAHNDYLQVLAEAGVAGAGLLCLAIAWGLLRLVRRYRSPVGGDTDRIWLGCWAAAAAGLAVASAVNSTVSVVPTAAAFAVFTAAVAAHLSLQRPWLRFRARLLLLPLAVAVIALPPQVAPLVRTVPYGQDAFRAAAAGRYTEAVDAFRRAAATDPLDGTVLPYLGDLLADLYIRKIDSSLGPWQTGRDRAAALYVLAERLIPWDGYPHAALGRLRRTEHRDADAVTAFREAIALDPYSPRYRLWLGDILADLGDRRGAAEQLGEAVRLYAIEMRVIERHEGRSAWYAQDQAGLAQAHALLSRVGAMAP